MCEVMVFFAELDDIVFECGMTDETVGGVDVEGAAVGVGARCGVGVVAEVVLVMTAFLIWYRESAPPLTEVF